MVLVLVVVSACATTRSAWDFRRELLATEAMADRRQYAEAIEGYESLAERAEREDDLHYLRYRIAYMYEQLGDLEEALARYEAMYRNPTGSYDDYAARAMVRTARIIDREYGDRDEARRLWVGTVRTFPNTNFAEDAYRELKRDYRDRGMIPELIELLSGLHAELQNTEIADNIVYDIGRMLHEDLDECEEAIEMYRLLTIRFQRSSLVDDALWHIGRCYRALGDIDREYAHLLSFVDGRELSIILADYNYTYYNPSYKRLAEIHEERGELRDAIAIYRRFQRTFPLSLDNDDMQYLIMRHQLTLGEPEEAVRSYRLLVREWPESRYVRRGEQLLRDAGVEP